MKATGIVRRIDDLGRVVIPKEIRRTMRIRERDPLHTTLTLFDRFCFAIHSVMERYKEQAR
jgi:AbrB family looped-hinge helix DNA binding protein